MTTQHPDHPLAEGIGEDLSEDDAAFVAAAEQDPYGIATEEGPTEGHVVNAFGGDWDDVVDQAASLGEERIVVNMGPQHPSTHGVLRLILEIDGETVTETRAGIGYLHTGIEKNMEFRTWTQGVTFCTRMDYLTPMFQETAYCLGVERLLGVTDQIPERASVIRVLMMELTRISSHLVALATGGMEMGATTVMTVGFRERERILAVIELITGLRMNNAYVRPGGVSQDTPSGAIDRIRDMVPAVKKGVRELELLLLENPILKGRTVDVGYLDLTGCIALGITGPVLRATGLPHDLRKLSPYCGYEGYEFDVITRESADAYGRLCIRLDEIRESLKIVEQAADRLQHLDGPVMIADKKIAWPAQLALGSDGLGNSLDHIKNIMGTSMESLIHHFKLVTEGFRVPPGQVYQAVESPKGELGVHVVSDGGTRPYRAHFRDPSFNNLQATAAMCEGGQIADVIVAVASIDPVMGGVDR
jgi:NADH-quinone oxidoreductase subunit D